MVKVSVIIPVYNAAPYLRKCLDSLVQQSLKDIEIICVDDSSADGSAEILKEYSHADSRVRYIFQQNAGAGSARNTGMQCATGKYLSFLDADDFFEHNMLESAYELAERDCADIVVYESDQYNGKEDLLFFASEIVDISKIPPYQPFNYRQLTGSIFKTFLGWTWDKLFLKEFIENNNLKFQHLKSSNDLYFVYSALVLAGRISVCREVLAHQRRDNDGSVSKSRENSWGCCYEAMTGLKKTLIDSGKFEEFERDFADYALTFMLWNYNTLREPEKSKLLEKLKNGWFKNLGITEENHMFFLNHDEYDQFVKILDDKD